MQTTDLILNGASAFSSSSLQPVWDTLDSKDIVRYRVHLSALGTSGAPLTANSYLDLIDYGASSCLSYSGVPVSADQFDPWFFGETYPTQEIFCE